jgi:hypothetical protein
MIGATVLTLAGGEVALALIPLAVGLLSAFVAYGRWRLAPLRRVMATDERNRLRCSARGTLR